MQSILYYCIDLTGESTQKTCYICFIAHHRLNSHNKHNNNSNFVRQSPGDIHTIGFFCNILSLSLMLSAHTDRNMG